MTQYKLQLLETTIACDELLQMAYKEHRSLVKEKLSLELQKDEYESRLLQITRELTKKQDAQKLLSALIEALPEGSLKEENIRTQKRLEFAAFELLQRQAHYSPKVLIKKQLMLERVNKQLEATGTFIESLEAHKQSLQKLLNPEQATGSLTSGSPEETH